jgi:hypothetical protein
MITTSNSKVSVSDIIRYEEGDMTVREMVYFFSLLIRSGMLNRMQGSYGRMASQMFQYGLLDASGQVNRNNLEDFIDRF